jgi:hypothetical protein
MEPNLFLTVDELSLPYRSISRMVTPFFPVTPAILCNSAAMLSRSNDDMKSISRAIGPNLLAWRLADGVAEKRG